ncbi:MAG: DNA processing protein [Marinomonas primoryensis]|jgi:DNA processing protein
MDTPYAAGLTQTDWLCLSFLSGIGPARLSRLYTYLTQLHSDTSQDQTKTASLFETDSNSPDIISYDILRALKWPEVTARQAMDYLSTGTLTEEQVIKRDQSLSWLMEPHHFLVLQEDLFYPGELKEISVAPAFLYVEGHRNALALPKIGIVGARKCTRHGRDITFQLAEQLASHGICVVSGGAIGIDTAAHQGALQGKATPTIGVMGTGLLHRYPTQNTALFEQIVEQGGALISEYPLTTSPRPHLFPPRNRIISGLSMGVLVAEASIKSGSLISASYAVQQNRDVFALPGRLSDKQSEGCHQLLRQGATLVRNVDDILEECSATSLIFENTAMAQNKAAERTVGHGRTSLHGSFHQIPESASEGAKTLAIALEKESTAMDFDALIRLTQMSAGMMMQALMELELSGCIENREGLYGRC